MVERSQGQRSGGESQEQRSNPRFVTDAADRILHGKDNYQSTIEMVAKNKYVRKNPDGTYSPTNKEGGSLLASLINQRLESDARSTSEREKQKKEPKIKQAVDDLKNLISSGRVNSEDSEKVEDLVAKLRELGVFSEESDTKKPILPGKGYEDLAAELIDLINKTDVIQSGYARQQQRPESILKEAEEERVADLKADERRVKKNSNARTSRAINRVQAEYDTRYKALQNEIEELKLQLSGAPKQEQVLISKEIEEKKKDQEEIRSQKWLNTYEISSKVNQDVISAENTRKNEEIIAELSGDYAVTSLAEVASQYAHEFSHPNVNLNQIIAMFHQFVDEEFRGALAKATMQQENGEMPPISNKDGRFTYPEGSQAALTLARLLADKAMRSLVREGRVEIDDTKAVIQRLADRDINFYEMLRDFGDDREILILGRSLRAGEIEFADGDFVPKAPEGKKLLEECLERIRERETKRYSNEVLGEIRGRQDDAPMLAAIDAKIAELEEAAVDKYAKFSSKLILQEEGYIGNYIQGYFESRKRRGDALAEIKKLEQIKDSYLLEAESTNKAEAEARVEVAKLLGSFDSANVSIDQAVIAAELASELVSLRSFDRKVARKLSEHLGLEKAEKASIPSVASLTEGLSAEKRQTVEREVLKSLIQDLEYNFDITVNNLSLLQKAAKRYAQMHLIQEGAVEHLRKMNVLNRGSDKLPFNQDVAKALLEEDIVGMEQSKRKERERLLKTYSSKAARQHLENICSDFVMEGEDKSLREEAREEAEAIIEKELSLDFDSSLYEVDTSWGSISGDSEISKRSFLLDEIHRRHEIRTGQVVNARRRREGSESFLSLILNFLPRVNNG